MKKLVIMAIVMVVIIAGLSLLYMRDSYKPITCPEYTECEECIECEEYPECPICPECPECKECLDDMDCIDIHTTPVVAKPIRYKDGNYENYCNYEVRCAIRWSREYFGQEQKFKEEEHKIWILWDDYRSRVCPGVDYDTRMYYYNYWIISYSVGI